MHLEFEAIGTHWHLEIYDEIENKEYIEFAVRKTINDFEDKYSRFRDDSLITKLNTKKELTDFPEELYAMISKSNQLTEITEGHFSVFVGTVLEAWGYDKKYSFEKKDLNIHSDAFTQGFKVFTKDRIEIDENLKVDLGGIGKGWIIDIIVELLQLNKIKNFLVNAGGDIYFASDKEDPATIYLENPFNLSQAIGEIEILNSACANSAPTRRKWKDNKEGKEYHHLVNMKTQENTDFFSSVYTIANNVVNADLASTALFVSPIEYAAKIKDALDIEFLGVKPDATFLISQNYKVKLYN